MRLSRAELGEQSAFCAKLEKLGIEAKCGEGQEPKANRFALKEIHPEFARVHDLPDGSVTVTLPAKLTVISSVMFTQAAVFPEFDDCPLDLEGPGEHRYFAEFVKDFPTPEPTILNGLLLNHPVPLRVCQRSGLIIASGWSCVPAKYDDEKPVKFELWLRDEYGEEFSVEFVARVDRRLKRMYEKRRPDPLTLYERRAKHVSLFSQKKEPAVYGDPAESARPGKAKTSTSPRKYRGTIQ